MNLVFEWRDAPAAQFAVIGDPVSHSRSPRMHEAAYKELGLPYQYLAIRVVTGEVAAALDHLGSLGYRGINVTIPHKSEALAWASEVDELGQLIGAVNTLELGSGRATNTDAGGFLDTLQELGLRGSEQVVLLGAGGTARALAAVLPEAGFRVGVWNRTTANAERLAAEFGLEVLDSPTANADLIVNTTSVGLTGDRLPIDWSEANPNAIAYDLVYGETAFLREAELAGLKTLDGKPLLAAQGARALEWWLGISAPREAMLRAIQ